MRSTSVKNVRQIGLFLQNKANLYKAKINASSFVTSEYSDSTILQKAKNKANQSQLSPAQGRGLKVADDGKYPMRCLKNTPVYMKVVIIVQVCLDALRLVIFERSDYEFS